MKLIKKLLLFILLLSIIAFSILFMFVKSIQTEVSNSDLPADVYSEQGDLFEIAKLKLVQLIWFTGSEDDYTLVEEFINYYILDLIHNSLNEAYDPFQEPSSDETSLIIQTEYYYINYLYAHLSEDNQLIITVSIGSDYLIPTETTLSLYFDITVSITDLSLTLTLTEVFLDTISISFNTLDKIFSYVDKEAIEDSVSTGTLDLDEYTYNVSIINP